VGQQMLRAVMSPPTSPSRPERTSRHQGHAAQADGRGLTALAAQLASGQWHGGLRAAGMIGNVINTCSKRPGWHGGHPNAQQALSTSAEGLVTPRRIRVPGQAVAAAAWRRRRRARGARLVGRTADHLGLAIRSDPAPWWLDALGGRDRGHFPVSPASCSSLWQLRSRNSRLDTTPLRADHASGPAKRAPPPCADASGRQSVEIQQLGLSGGSPHALCFAHQGAMDAAAFCLCLWASAAVCGCS